MKEWVSKYWPQITFSLMFFGAAMGKLYEIDVNQKLMQQQQVTIIQSIAGLNGLFQERLNSNISLIDYKLHACGCDSKA